MKKLLLLFASVCLLVSNLVVARDANLTKYPIVFAHGLGGFDDILGYDYWGNDSGQYVLDPCDKFLETSCNWDINSKQKSFISQVVPLHNSEVRGLQLADNIERYMAQTGVSHVNIVSHSMGGIDARKAAKELYFRKGYRVVKTHISISTPHRGSPVAKYILDNFRDTIVPTLANYYGGIVYGSGNDAVEAAKQLIYNDYESSDGKVTGMKDFNQRYPASTNYIENSVSLMTAQNGASVNPALWLLSNFLYDIDGDGYCIDDCDNDGAAGSGDGYANERDDDGLVGINSQQQGLRLRYLECFGCLDYVVTDNSIPAVTNLNRPSSAAMTSKSSVINQDHLDVVGVGPDQFDEMEFYAAIVDYIADYGH